MSGLTQEQAKWRQEHNDEFQEQRKIIEVEIRSTAKMKIFRALIIGLALILCMMMYVEGVRANDTSDLAAFLAQDGTDSHEYLPWYSCGHFSRDLARNASLHNISLGSVMMGNHPTFRGHDTHIINYIEINGSMYFIEPQTDGIRSIGWISYRYLRFYPDGTQVPTNWVGNLAHDLDLFPTESHK